LGGGGRSEKSKHQSALETPPQKDARGKNLEKRESWEKNKVNSQLGELRKGEEGPITKGLLFANWDQ